MTDSTEQFNQQVHDAYERVEMDEATQNRMLKTLLAAQAQREGVEETQLLPKAPADVPATRLLPKTPAAMPATQVAQPRRHAASHAQVDAYPRKRPAWKVWLPLAAVVAAALIVVRITTSSMFGAKTDSNATVAQTEMSATAESDAQKVSDVATGTSTSEESYASVAPVSETSAEEADVVEDGSVPDAEVIPREETSFGFDASNPPAATLDDGTSLSLVLNGTEPVAVDAGLVGELVGTGTLSSGPSGDASYSCEVYQIAGDEASFALVSPLTNGEYWLCSQV